jgi:hypothetical protein
MAIHGTSLSAEDHWSRWPLDDPTERSRNASELSKPNQKEIVKNGGKFENKGKTTHLWLTAHNEKDENSL